MICLLNLYDTTFPVGLNDFGSIATYTDKATDGESSPSSLSHSINIPVSLFLPTSIPLDILVSKFPVFLYSCIAGSISSFIALSSIYTLSTTIDVDTFISLLYLVLPSLVFPSLGAI